MKRFWIGLFCILLALGTACAPGAKNPAAKTDFPAVTDAGAEEPPSHSPEPEQPAGPELPLVFNLYDAYGFSAVEGTMFEYDFDRDGTPEPITFSLDPEADTTTIAAGEQSVTLGVSSMLDSAILLDLDPESPRLNLLVVIDEASDDYVTTELHLENGALTAGPVTYGRAAWADGKLKVCEPFDLLGTMIGERVYGGDSMEPESDWIALTDALTEEELNESFDDLKEFGTLLHTAHRLPCETDGAQAWIAEDSYVYCRRARVDRTEAELVTLDGVVAVIRPVYDSETETYRIDGVNVEDYFDNLFYAD